MDKAVEKKFNVLKDTFDQQDKNKNKTVIVSLSYSYLASTTSSNVSILSIGCSFKCSFIPIAIFS